VTEIRRLRIVGVVDGEWTWTDVVTGQRGRLHRCRADVEVGATVLVEVRAEGTSWRAVRWLDPAPAAPDHAADVDRAPVLVDGAPIVVRDEPAARTPLAPGTIRTVFQGMDGRSTAARDAGASEKVRPAVIVAHEPGSAQVEVSLVYGTNSAVRRSGTGRRIRDWRAAGLRKPSVLASAVEVRAVDDLGPVIGRLTPADRDRLLGD